MKDQHPPHDADAEARIIGCLLTSPEMLRDCEDYIGDAENFFYDLRYWEIYKSIRSISDSAIPVDISTVQSELRKRGMLEQVGGIIYLSKLQDDTTSSSNLPVYLESARQSWCLREVIKTCSAAMQSSLGGDGAPEHLDSIVSQVVATFRKLEHRGPGKSRVVNPDRASVMLVDELQRRFDLQGKRSGVATGFEEFDRKTDGLQYGDLTILAARPSVGKTALALNIAEYAAIKNKVPTIFVTLESSVSSLTRRLLGMWARISSGTLRGGTFTENDFKKFSVFKRMLTESPLYFINAVGGASMRQISTDVRRICDEADIKLVVVDYLQKIRSAEHHEKRTYEVGEVSTGLKFLAGDTGAAVLSLAQLNRDSEKVGEKSSDGSRRPRLTDLADSKQIEADADLVVALHRKTRMDSESELLLLKGRDCELGICPLNYEGQFYRFTDRQNPNRQIDDSDVPTSTPHND